MTFLFNLWPISKRSLIHDAFRNIVSEQQEFSANLAKLEFLHEWARHSKYYRDWGLHRYSLGGKPMHFPNESRGPHPHPVSGICVDFPPSSKVEHTDRGLSFFPSSSFMFSPSILIHEANTQGLSFYLHTLAGLEFLWSSIDSRSILQSKFTCVLDNRNVAWILRLCSTRRNLVPFVPR